MELLFPQFLYGLFALSIPIIIHLFNFRRYKVVRFPTTRFLKEVQEESQKRSKLRHLLILLSRLLLITAIVLAFCQPVIPTQDDVFRTKLNAIVIDNSYSMDMDLEGGRALEVAKNKAFELISSMEEDADYLIFTADHQNETNQSIGQRDALERIKSIGSSSAVFDLPAVQSRIKWKSEQASSNSMSFYFTDLQKNKINNSFTTDSLNRVKIFHLSREDGANLSIDSCWFEDAVRRLGVTEELFFEIQNYGKEDREFELRLSIDGRTMGREQLKIAGNSSLRSSASFRVSETGVHKGVLSIEDSPITFDDDFHFTYVLEESLPILYLSDEKDSLWASITKVFETDSNFLLKTQLSSAIDYSVLEEYPLIILGGLKKVDQGLTNSLYEAFKKNTSLCVIPSLKSDRDAYDLLFNKLELPIYGPLVLGQERVKTLELESDFFQGVFEKLPESVDLPLFNSYYKSTASISKNSTLMSLMNGVPVLSEYRSDNSSVYIFNSSPEAKNSNFSRHALFVPSFLQMAINSRKSGELYVVNRERLLINKPRKVEDPEEWIFKSISDSAIYFPTISSQHFVIPEFKGEPGFYELFNKMTKETFTVAINSNREESDLRILNNEEVKTLDNKDFIDILNVSGVEQAGLVKEMSKDTELWQLFLLLALLFAAFEIILIKL